ncbi:MAG TPA: DivIVA domain-containing protein [Actinomycetes bacterium]|nr:DivIVA domain-containing protein [Actinomycetes bacterium]HJW62826.1 DivIVA domain-containing protein [Actinomycetes bacterium]
MPPLTPLDIQHKEFTKAMRGYAMHEVDTFLDQVTEEFTRMQDEIARLREQASSVAQPQPAPVQMQAPPPPPPPQPQPVAAEARGGGAGGEEAIARALVMAQRMADQTVEEAKVKAKSMVAEAEARAKNMTEQAQMRAREVTEAAQMRAREVTEAAQARARELTEGLETRYKERIQSAEARARVAEEQARMQIAQATEQVARRRQELESSIEALRAFERDYRARLRGFVEGQLKALEDAAPSGPVAPPQPPGLGGNSRPLPGADDLPALSTGARQSSYSSLRDNSDQLGHNGRDRVDRLRHDD